MSEPTRRQRLLKSNSVKSWYDNMAARSKLSADVSLRNFGLYCELNSCSPEDILNLAKTGKLKQNFLTFVRKMESEGKSGGYILKFKKTLLSWVRFNDISYTIKANIQGENDTPTLVNERVPSKEELARIFRKSTSRGRVAAAFMAFCGPRPESLGDYEGKDGIKLSDITGLKITGSEVKIDKIPALLTIRKNLSKARNQYFTFIPEEGITYLQEYLMERIRDGEDITYDSPLLQLDTRGVKKNKFLRTPLVTRDIRDAIVLAGLNLRPYVLRAYFATALDIAESKGLISHPWRQFIMGHKGDIEARYSTNKRLPLNMIEEMRESYRKCTKFLETRVSEPSENEAKTYLQQQLLLAVGYKQGEIDKIDLAELDNEAFQKLLRDKVTGTMAGNGSKQRLIDISEIGSYLDKGYEFQASLPNGKAVMKLPF